MAEGCGQEGGHEACWVAHDEGDAAHEEMPSWELDVLSCAALRRGGKPCAVDGTIEQEFKHSTGVCAAGRSLSQPRALGTILFFLEARCELTGLC